MTEESIQQQYRVIAKVIRQEGLCVPGHKVGDEFEVAGGRGLVPPGMCSWALYAVLPFAQVVLNGGTLPWTEDADTDEELFACPDGTNPNGNCKVIFALRRERRE